MSQPTSEPKSAPAASILSNLRSSIVKVSLRNIHQTQIESQDRRIKVLSAGLRKKDQELTDLRNTTDPVEARLKKTKKDLERFQGAYDTQTRILIDTEQALETKDEQNRDLREEVRKWKKESDSLGEKIEALEEAIKEDQSRVTRLQAENEDLSTTISELRAHASSHSEKCIQQNLNEANEKARLSRENTSLGSANKNLVKDESNLRKEVGKSKQKVISLRRDPERSKQDIKVVREDVKIAEDYKDSSDKTITEQQQEIKIHDTGKKRLIDKIQETQYQLDAAATSLPVPSAPTQSRDSRHDAPMSTQDAQHGTILAQQNTASNIDADFAQTKGGPDEKKAVIERLHGHIGTEERKKLNYKMRKDIEKGGAAKAKKALPTLKGMKGGKSGEGARKAVGGKAAGEKRKRGGDDGDDHRDKVWVGPCQAQGKTRSGYWRAQRGTKVVKTVEK